MEEQGGEAAADDEDDNDTFRLLFFDFFLPYAFFIKKSRRASPHPEDGGRNAGALTTGVGIAGTAVVEVVLDPVDMTTVAVVTVTEAAVIGGA